MYTVDYFIKKFSAIPEDKWCVSTYGKNVTKEVIRVEKLFGIIPRKFKEEVIVGYQYCAQGHCMEDNNVINYVLKAQERGLDRREIAKSYPEWNALICLFKNNGLPDVGNVNNGNSVSYQQHTPKQRILKALYDIKQKQETPVDYVIEKALQTSN